MYESASIPEKPRLLVVLTQPLTPLRTGSSIVAYNSLSRLTSRFSIDLVCPIGGEVDQKFAEKFTSINFAPLRKKSSNGVAGFVLRAIALARRLMGCQFPFDGLADDAAMHRIVQILLEKSNYAGVLTFEMISLRYIPLRLFGQTVVHLEDPHSIRFMKLAKLPSATFWRKWWAILFAIKIRKFEKRVLPRVGCALLLSQADLLEIKIEHPSARFHWVPYAVQRTCDDQLVPRDFRKYQIVYTGNMFHPANVDGAIFFLNEIFPMILYRLPSAQLWIVGASPDKRIVSAASTYGESVILTGAVDDVSLFVRRAMVSVCPVRLRIGVQTKVLEALAMGTPVVTTSAGNAGIQADNGRHLWVADDPKLFAERVLSLLAGYQWQEISQGGKRYVDENFSWDVSALELTKIIFRVMERVLDQGLQDGLVPTPRKH